MAMVAVVTLVSTASADPINGMHLRGTFTKDNRHSQVGYHLRLGDERLAFTLEGATVAIPQFTLISEIHADMSGVAARKVGYVGGVPRAESLVNTGGVVIYPSERHFNAHLVGVPVTGTLVQGIFDDGIWFDGINAGGHASRGNMDYSPWSGYYIPSADLSFAGYAIRSANSDGYILNYDSAMGQNIFYVSMRFGALLVRGQIQFSDVVEEHEERHCSRDSDGDEDCHTETVREVVSTTGNVHLYVSAANGRPLDVDAPGSEGASEPALRAFLAWLQVVAHDIASE
jgi:hypothetical protein